MIQIRGLKVDKAGMTICHVPHLEIESGERLAIVGTNGSGKTTLLRVVSGLECQFIGQCDTVAPWRERVFVHQTPYLFRGSVLFNASYGLAARKIPRRERTWTAQHWLDVFGVGHLASRKCTHLSGGEQRRVALARAFATQPSILLLDEPLADLDQAGIAAVVCAIAASNRSTILISSPTPLPNEFGARSHHLAPFCSAESVSRDP